jgi:hypothetical protein
MPSVWKGRWGYLKFSDSIRALVEPIQLDDAAEDRPLLFRGIDRNVARSIAKRSEWYRRAGSYLTLTDLLCGYWHPVGNEGSFPLILNRAVADFVVRHPQKVIRCNRTESARFTGWIALLVGSLGSAA